MVFTFFLKIEKFTLSKQTLLSTMSQNFKRSGSGNSGSQNRSGKNNSRSKKFTGFASKKSGSGKNVGPKKTESKSVNFDSETKNELICLLFIALCPNKHPSKYNLNVVSKFLEKKSFGWENDGLFSWLSRRNLQSNFFDSFKKLAKFLNKVDQEKYKNVFDHLEKTTDFNDIVVKYKSLMTELTTHEINFYDAISGYNSYVHGLKELSADCLSIFHNGELAVRNARGYIDFRNPDLLASQEKRISYTFKLSREQRENFETFFKEKGIPFEPTHISCLMFILNLSDDIIYDKIMNGEFDFIEMKDELKSFLSTNFLSNDMSKVIQKKALEKLRKDNIFNREISFQKKDFPAIGTSKNHVNEWQPEEVDNFVQDLSTSSRPFSNSFDLAQRTKNPVRIESDNEQNEPEDKDQVKPIEAHVIDGRKLNRLKKDTRVSSSEVAGSDWPRGRPRFFSNNDKQLLTELLDKLSNKEDVTKEINDLLNIYAISTDILSIEESAQSSQTVTEKNKRRITEITQERLKIFQTIEELTKESGVEIKKGFERFFKENSKVEDENDHFYLFLKKCITGDQKLISTLKGVDINSYSEESTTLKCKEKFPKELDQHDPKLNEKMVKNIKKRIKKMNNKIRNVFKVYKLIIQNMKFFDGSATKEQLKIGAQNDSIEKNHSDSTYFLMLTTKKNRNNIPFADYDFTKLKGETIFWEYPFEKEVIQRKLESYVRDLASKKTSFHEFAFRNNLGIDVVRALNNFFEDERTTAVTNMQDLYKHHHDGILIWKNCLSTYGVFTNNFLKIPKHDIKSEWRVVIGGKTFYIKDIKPFKEKPQITTKDGDSEDEDYEQNNQKKSIDYLKLYLKDSQINNNIKLKEGSKYNIEFFKVQFAGQKIKELLIKEETKASLLEEQRKITSIPYYDNDGGKTEWNKFVSDQGRLNKQIKALERKINSCNEKLYKGQKDIRMDKQKEFQDELDSLKKKSASYFQMKVNGYIKNLDQDLSHEQLEELTSQIRANEDFQKFEDKLFGNKLELLDKKIIELKEMEQEEVQDEITLPLED